MNFLQVYGQNITSLTLVFAVVIILFLIIDLGILNRHAKEITTRSALLQTIFWISVSIAFGALIYVFGGGEEHALKYFSAYLTEKALSVDNIFVIILILQYFKVEKTHYHKILFWGILGAIVFRAVFIFLGAFLVTQFHWILYIFGIFLVYSGIRLLFNFGSDDVDPGKSPIIRFGRKYLNITKENFGDKFVLFEKGKLMFTPLFLVLVLIEVTDLIFAVDSIPAAFAITTNEFLIYTSNIFAVLGLRALFFLLAGVLDKFYLLEKGLSFVLIFIGAKMLIEIVHIYIPIAYSFTTILTLLISSILISVLFPKKLETLEEIVETPQIIQKEKEPIES